MSKKKKQQWQFLFLLLQKKSLEHNQKSDKTRVSMNNKDSKTLISHYLPVNLKTAVKLHFRISYCLENFFTLALNEE